MALIRRAAAPICRDNRPNSHSFAQLRGWAVLGLVLLLLAVLGGMLWRNVDRLQKMREFTAFQHRIQGVAIDIQATLTDFFRNANHSIDAEYLARLSAKITAVSREQRYVAPETPGNLADLARTVEALTVPGISPPQQEALLLEALAISNTMLDAENLQRGMRVEEVGRLTRAEITLTLLAVACLLLLMSLFLRFRILNPLKDLERLLLRLAREDFTPIETQGIDRLLLPVFDNYNHMVEQLAALKDAERHHAESLEAEVRSATRALLEQQASLARSERLAAVGELAAGVAHELRNPLAGIQMTCVNLRAEIQDEGQGERISLVIGELKRMSRLLNELLDQSKHTPVPVQEFNLSAMIQELVALVRYQIPAEIRLIFEGPPDLRCRLPEPRLRQCLLNLILNSAEAIGPSPGAIRIEAQREGDRLLLTMTDSGPGFPPELLERGIRPFATGRPGGTGLGLAMVQRFVRDSGGTLVLSNLEPRGAHVQIRLPGEAG